MISSYSGTNVVPDFIPEAQDVLEFAESIDPGLPSGANGRDIIAKLGINPAMSRWMIFRVLQGAVDDLNDAWNDIVDDETAKKLNLFDINAMEEWPPHEQDAVVSQHFADLNQRIARVCWEVIGYLKPGA